jgi:hypothetical protein
MIAFSSRVVGLVFIVAGTASVAIAGIDPVPEIDPTTASSAIALLAGAAMIARDKFRLR